MIYHKTLLKIATRLWFNRELDECIKSQDEEFAKLRLNDYFEMMKLIEKMED